MGERESEISGGEMSTFALSFPTPVSLCIFLPLRSLSFLIISHKFCGFWLAVYVYIDQLRN